jgi:hypothetical protein
MPMICHFVCRYLIPAVSVLLIYGLVLEGAFPVSCFLSYTAEGCSNETANNYSILFFSSRLFFIQIPTFGPMYVHIHGYYLIKY